MPVIRTHTAHVDVADGGDDDIRAMHGWNPAWEWSDADLRRKFKTLYGEVHFHGLRGGALALAALWAYERELIARGMSPADVVPGRVITPGDDA